MSEKIYACLLRLFPSAFRRLYEEEALQLLRERLRDERGFFRRLRLIRDLFADFIEALPRAYKNSYAQAAPAASLTLHFDGVPSFQVLPKEPMRRETVVVASVLSLTALAAFMYVMERPGPYRHAARNGRISPIEAVLEQLNQPMSADVAGGVSTDVSPSASTDTSQTKRPAPYRHAARNGRISPIEARPEQLNQPIPAGVAGGVSTDVSPSASTDTSQPVYATGPVSVRDSDRQTPTAISTDLSGEWTLIATGADASVPRRFIFRQKGSELSGTGGPDSAGQYPIIHGLVAGDAVRFELNDGRTEFLYDMKGEGQEIRGTLSIRSAGGMRVATVRLQRSR